MSARNLPFIPAWLDEARLSQADFRLYCHLCRRADKDGIAWPQADSIARDCYMAKNTVWKSLKRLEAGKFIRRKGKPFAGSNRYQILVPIGANQIPNGETPISANETPIEAAPIGANEIRQSAQMDSHQSAQMDSREGSPLKVLHLRESNKGVSIELPFPSIQFQEAWQDWVQHRIEIKKRLTPTSITKQFKDLLAMGEPAAIASINNSVKNGWQGLFQAPTNGSKPTTIVNTGRRTSNIEEL